MSQRPFLILDTPRGPDGTCWFVTDPINCDEGLVARLGTLARQQHKAGQALLGADYIAVAQQAVQVRDDGRRPAYELLILAGLNRPSMGAEAGLRQLLSDHLSKLHPMSGSVLASDAGSSGIVRSGAVIREVERDVLDQLPTVVHAARQERKPSGINRAFRQTMKALLVMIAAVAMGIVSVLVIKPYVQTIRLGDKGTGNSDEMPRSRGGKLDFISKDKRWQRLAVAYGLPDRSTDEQRKAFVADINRELNLPEDSVPVPDDGASPTELQQLLNTGDDYEKSTAASVSKKLLATDSEDWKELKLLAAELPDSIGADGTFVPRHIVFSWWTAFKKLHESESKLDVASEWREIGQPAPVEKIPFLTPMDAKRLKVIAHFLDDMVKSDDEGKSKAWESADWKGKLKILSDISKRKTGNKQLNEFFATLASSFPSADTVTNPRAAMP